MNCQTVRESISGYIDRRVRGEEWTRATRHIAKCRECAMHLDKLTQMREDLLSLAEAPVPAALETRLLVVASRERTRWNGRKTLPLALRTWTESLRLTVDNLMRPVAVPLAGGVISALFLFSMLVPTLGYRPAVGTDVPIGLYTSATLVEVSPLAINGDETVVELYIDSKGQAMDYSVQGGKLSPEFQADLTQMMVFSRFTPATWFGQPMNGKVLVSFRRVQYVVRG
jgi:hypothetical protein